MPGVQRTFVGWLNQCATSQFARCDVGGVEPTIVFTQNAAQLQGNSGATGNPTVAFYIEELIRERSMVMKVKSSMHKGVQWMSPDTPVKALAKTMLEQDIGAIPIGENDRLVGMVTDRDIAVRAVANGKDISALTARDVMTKGIVWCRDSDDVSHAANVMQTKQIRRLPVIDKNKRMTGILSLGDLSHAATERTTATVTKAVSAHHE